MTKVESLRKDFTDAVARLAEAIELCCKYLKAYLEEMHNSICTSPRSCFRAAFKQGMIANDPFWMDLAKLRNYTVHTYNETLADYVYAQLPEALDRFRAVLEVSG
jgi:nucleotidyltransferase substrate binding protein (TIGR01987 family)